MRSQPPCSHAPSALLELLVLLHSVVLTSHVHVDGQMPALQGAGSQLLWDTGIHVDVFARVVPGVCAGQLDTLLSPCLWEAVLLLGLDGAEAWGWHEALCKPGCSSVTLVSDL